MRIVKIIKKISNIEQEDLQRIFEDIDPATNHIDIYMFSKANDVVKYTVADDVIKKEVIGKGVDTLNKNER